MSRLNDEELKNMKAGFNIWGCFGLIGLGAFLVGILDGFTNPISCR